MMSGEGSTAAGSVSLPFAQSVNDVRSSLERFGNKSDNPGLELRIRYTLDALNAMGVAIPGSGTCDPRGAVPRTGPLRRSPCRLRPSLRSSCRCRGTRLRLDWVPRVCRRAKIPKVELCWGLASGVPVELAATQVPKTATGFIGNTALLLVTGSAGWVGGDVGDVEYWAYEPVRHVYTIGIAGLRIVDRAWVRGQRRDRIRGRGATERQGPAKVVEHLNSCRLLMPSHHID